MVPECFISEFSGIWRAADRSLSYIMYGLVTLFTFKLAVVSPCFSSPPEITGFTTGGVPSASTSLPESPHSLSFSDLVSLVLLMVYSLSPGWHLQVDSYGCGFSRSFNDSYTCEGLRLNSPVGCGPLPCSPVFMMATLWGELLRK